MKVKIHHLYEHETKRHASIRYIISLSILLGYMVYAAYKYDVSNGVYIALLTWSFFVLSTPIADAGFLLDFPIRLMFNIRMIYSEIIVWIIAITLNILTLIAFPNIYQTTALLSIFHTILTNPFPYWIIIILSCIGTFMSIYFGDELVDVVEHKERKAYHQHHWKYKLIFFITIFLLTLVAYYHLIEKIGLSNIL